jgi:hypothetical protein
LRSIRSFKDCLTVPSDDVWQKYIAESEELVVESTYDLEFFPASVLDGQYRLSRLFRRDDVGDGRVLLIGEGEKLRGWSQRKNSNTNSLIGASSSPWSRGGCLTGSGPGGCFSGCLSLIGLAFLVSLVLCLAFGECRFLYEWCPCFNDSTEKAPKPVEEVFGYFEVQSDYNSKIQVLVLDEGFEILRSQKIRPESDALSEYHVFKIPINRMNQEWKYFVVLDSSSTSCRKLNPVSIDACRFFETDTCVTLQIENAASDSCGNSFNGYDSWRDLQQLITKGVAKELRFAGQ